MLIRFEVKNYKGFKNNLIWDLSSTRPYSDKKHLIKNKISKHCIVYGKNESGKTSLCTAVMDITSHLLDVERDLTPAYKFSYLGNDSNIIEFKYCFMFDKKKVEYIYKEMNTRELIYEKLIVNNVAVLVHDFIDESGNYIKIKGAEKLRTNGLQKSLSVIKYIYNNTIVDDDSIIGKLYKFVRGMLGFRSLKEANQYFGFKLGSETLDSFIIMNNKLEDFNKFLSDMELDYKLVPLKLSSDNIVVGAKYENGKVIPFNDIASSGSRVLMLFFYWLSFFDQLTFLIIDEFDAYYHHDVSYKIISIIQSFDNLQSMVTTHNVTLLNTEFTRPDCAYIIDKKGVINVCDRYPEQIKKTHNIEKMYRENKFN